nr:polyprenol monophosphomannose synthase [Actinomycetota bacterium]
MSGGGRALVIVPTYNERGNLREVVERTLGAGADIDLLIVDDASPDGTGALAKEMGETEPRANVLEREGKRGLGTAYVLGFGWALQRGYPAIVEMDADLSHDPADLPRLLSALEDADLAIGSRYIDGGHVRNWGAIRRALSSAANLYARVWLGYRVRDSTSGFRAYRRDTLLGQELSSIRSEGYTFQIEMTRRVARAGGRIVEVPITFVERASGRSKLNRGVVLEAMVFVTAWGLKDRLRRRPRALSGTERGR